MSTENEVTVYVDGEAITIDKMTFRERREVRRIAIDLSEDPGEDGDEYTIDDAVMAIIAVAKRRSTPDFDPESLLDDVPDAYLTAPPTSNGAGKARAAKRKTTA